MLTDYARDHLALGTVSAKLAGRERWLLVGVILVAAAIGLFATPPDVGAQAVERAGPELTRLLRGMAVLKALISLAAAGAIVWRFGATKPSFHGGVPWAGAPVSWVWFAAYAIVCAGMAAGPGLIWSMAYVRTGALLLHGGLFASIVLLWRDPGMGQRLQTAIAARRSAINARQLG
jgi:hypothetical protein